MNVLTVTPHKANHILYLLAPTVGDVTECPAAIGERIAIATDAHIVGFAVLSKWQPARNRIWLSEPASIEGHPIPFTTDDQWSVWP